MKRSKSRVVESMPGAAVECGVDIEIVKRAKRLACPAFLQGGRIDCDILKKWIAENAEALKSSGENVSRKDAKLDQEIRKLKIANDAKEKLTVSKERGMNAIANCRARIRPFLEQKLENEYPSVVVGMNDIAQIRVYGRKIHDQILAELQTLADEWQKI